MRKSAREFFAKQRKLRRAAAALRDARQIVVMPGPHSAKEYLVALGMDQDTAKRFAGAFSKGVPAARRTMHMHKLPGKRRGDRYKAVEVKLYDWDDFAGRLLTYRPAKDKNAAAKFAELAEIVAA